VILYNAVSLNSVDPLYPAVYESVTNISSALEYFDACLMHPNANGVLHYHAASPCLADNTLYTSSAGVSASYSDVKTYLT
jgi:hypothetical protein